MEVRHIYISKGHNYFGHHDQPPGEEPMVEVEKVECVAGKGLVGDRFYEYKDDYKGQVTFFSIAVYDNLCAQFQVYDREPSVFRRNVIVEGADLNKLIGEEFEVQGVRFYGTSEAAPCYWMEQAFHVGAEEAMKGQGGLRAKILTDGVLRNSAKLVQV